MICCQVSTVRKLEKWTQLCIGSRLWSKKYISYCRQYYKWFKYAGLSKVEYCKQLEGSYDLIRRSRSQWMSLICVVIAFLSFVRQVYWMSKSKRNVITSHPQHRDWQNNVTPSLLYPKFPCPNSWNLWLIMFHGKGHFVDVIIVDTLVEIFFPGQPSLITNP